MKDRMLRVNQEIKRRISEIILYELKDPRARWISITRCVVSADLHNADIFFLTFGDESEDEALEFLNRAKGYVRELLKKKVYLKYIPRLHFKVDQGLKIARELERKIKLERDNRGHKE